MIGEGRPAKPGTQQPFVVLLVPVLTTQGLPRFAAQRKMGDLIGGGAAARMIAGKWHGPQVRRPCRLQHAPYVLFMAHQNPNNERPYRKIKCIVNNAGIPLSRDRFAAHLQSRNACDTENSCRCDDPDLGAETTRPRSPSAPSIGITLSSDTRSRPRSINLSSLPPHSPPSAR